MKSDTKEEEENAIELTPEIDQADVNDGKWYVIFDGVKVDFSVMTKHSRPDVSVQLARSEQRNDDNEATMNLLIGDNCVKLRIGDRWARLEDLMFDHSNKKKNPEDCPGYRKRGYARWLLGLVDSFNWRFNSHTCKLWDSMYFLPGAGPALADDISPFLVIIRGYSLYEDAGYLPMEVVRTFDEMKKQIAAVNMEMKRRHHLLTDKETFQRIIQPFITDVAETRKKKAQAQKISKRTRLKVEETKAQVNTLTAFINNYHNPFCVAFMAVFRANDKAGILEFGDGKYGSTELLWYKNEKVRPYFLSDSKGMTIAEAANSDSIEFPATAFALIKQPDLRITDAIIESPYNRLYLVSDNHIAQKGRELASALTLLEKQKQRHERAKRTLDNIDRKLEFSEIVRKDGISSIRTAVQAIISVFDQTNHETRAWSQRFYQTVIDQLDIESDLNKMYKTFDDNTKVAIERTKDRETGAPQFHVHVIR